MAQGKSDGSVILDTRIDTNGIGEGIETVKNKIGSVSNSVKKFGDNLRKAFSAKEIAGGSGSELLFEQIQKEILDTENELERLKQKQRDFLSLGGTPNNQSYIETEKNIARVSARLEELRAKKTAFDSLSSSEKIAAENSQMLSNMINLIRNSFANLVPLARKASGYLLSLAGRAVIGGVRKLWTGLKRVVSSLTSIHKGARKSNRSLLMMLGSSLLFSTVFRAISALVNSFKEGVQNLSQYSSEANASMSALKTAAGQLKNSLATAFMPLITIITPALVSFINMLNRALTAIGAFFSALSGKSTFIKAIAVQQDYASSLDKTASSAKKAEKAQNSYTSSLDELNVVSNTETPEMSGVGGISPGQMFEEMPIDDAIMNFAEKLKEIFNRIKELIQNEDWDGLGEYLAEGINIAFQYLYDVLNWENVKDKVMPFITAFTQTFNSLVDNINWELIGRTIGTGFNTIVNILYELITGIDWGNLGVSIGESINGLFSEIDWTKAGATLGEAFKSLLDFLIGIIEETDWQKIGKSIAEFVGGIDWTGIVLRIANGIGAVLGMLSGLLIGLISEAWNSVVEWWREVAFQDGQFTMQGLLEGIWEIAQNIGEWLMENVVNPFIKGFKEAFGINSPSTVMAEFGVFIMQGLINGIESLITNLLLSLTKIKEKFLTTFTQIKEKVLEIWNKMIDGIKNAVNGIIRVINGMISGIVNGINGMISALNSLHFDVPDWVPGFGGKSFSFNISSISAPQIPYLATGEVIPPNAPFLAMLGDQRNGTNIEAPADLIRQIVREEAGGSREMMDLLTQIAQNTRETADKDLTIGDREIVKANLRGQSSMGYSLIVEG